MHALLTNIRHWFNERSSREKTLILLATLAVIYVFFKHAVFSPMHTTQKQLRRQAQNTEKEINRLNKEASLVIAGATGSAAEKTRNQQQLLHQKVILFNKQLIAFTAELVPPDKMAGILKTLFKHEPGLKLIKFNNQPAKLFYRPTRGGEATLYKHGMIIQFQGDFSGTLRYLERLEQLKGQLFWDDLDYRVIRYPNALVTLKVHTLSADEGWVGE